MKFNKVNGEHLYYMMSNAANKLELQSEYVNSLNVFPVPDGDTGTNMSMTFRAAVKEIEGMDNKNIGEVSKKLAKVYQKGLKEKKRLMQVNLLMHF